MIASSFEGPDCRLRIGRSVTAITAANGCPAYSGRCGQSTALFRCNCEAEVKNISLSEAVRRDLGAVVSTTWTIGLFFMIGLQSWLRGDPSYWVMVVSIPPLMLFVLLFCRRILKRLPAE
jgi:hypothetical protein